ncbi:DEP domain-containing protein 7-like [Genypterus blacodes]|uniref:DEP domain-containing protein 7-like n=1 Tax=Genypterus blacodes TaxID=154954 RepID=UPI003F776A2C
MATIKERAAALNLAEKLYVRPQGQGVTSKPAQSSFLWSGLISHLRATVTVKCHRIHLVPHVDSFLGSEAVNVLKDHISHVKGFEGAIVSREKVVCVCQVLLDCKVFESVVTKVFAKDKKQDVFQDSKSALYRFTRVNAPSVDELERGDLVHGIHKLFCSLPSDRQREPSLSPGVHVQMHTPVKLSPMPAKANQFAVPVFANRAVKLSPIPTKANELADPVFANRSLEDLVDDLTVGPSGFPQSCKAMISPHMVDEVWQEQTLLRLLQLVELPLLEGVLQGNRTSATPSPVRQPAHSNPDLLYSNNHLDRHILKAFRDSQEDEWLCAALDCLDFLPDQLVVQLSRELPQDEDNAHHVAAGNAAPEELTQQGSVSTPGHISDEQPQLSPSGFAQCKLLLYGTLVKHYSHTDRPPLLPQHMTDIYTAIAALLVNAKLGPALEALQLCLKLLPLISREELHRLLTFMALAADPQAIKLDKEMENRMAVKRSFSRAILHHKLFSKEKEDLLVVFMLSNIQEVFKIPGTLHKRVSDKLAGLAEGDQPDVTGSTFCQQVSGRSSSHTAKGTTNQELWALLSNIHQDPKMSSKKKKHHLGQFYQAHPEIFHQYFGDSLVDVL